MLKKSLTYNTLFQIAVRLILVIIVTSALSYWHVYTSLENQAISQLEKFALERAQREAGIFDLVRDNHAILKKELLERLPQTPPANTDSEFARLNKRYPDGATRTASLDFNSYRESGTWINKNTTLDQNVRYQAVLFNEMTTKYGPAWFSRYINTYILSPQNMIVIYWPENKGWVADATADFNMVGEEYFTVSTPANNPVRTTTWTGLYYDVVAKVWLVSGITPVDINGQHIASIGNDVPMDEVIKRTVNPAFANSYNLIFRADGRLIAHPDLMEKIREKGGNFQIKSDGDEHLQRIFQLSTTIAPGKVVIKEGQNGDYIAVTRIPGPDYYFVTVLKSAAIDKPAVETAQLLMLISFGAMLAELLILYLVLRSSIARPLTALTGMSEKLARGERQVASPFHRQDELGQLAHSFERLAQTVADRDTRLSATSQELLERASILKSTAQESASGSRQQQTAADEVKSAMSELTAAAGNIGKLADEIKTLSATVAANSRIIGATTATAVEQGTEGYGAVWQTQMASAAVTGLYEELLRQMEDLQTRSAAMRQVLNVINTVAAETHLLSLNAGIEAAGAGQHGERFKVIAQQVKDLAARSAASGREVMGNIAQLEATFGDVVAAVQNGEARARNLQTVADQTGTVIDGMRSIANDAQEQAGQILATTGLLNDLSERVERATQEQAAISETILQRMRELTVAARQQSESSSAVFDTAFELEQVSRQLSSVVEYKGSSEEVSES
jgi:methyl-accepting chemotaxis protein